MVSIHYRSTQGFALDTLITQLIRFSFQTREAYMTYKELKKCIDALPNLGKSLHVHLTWSGGAEATNQAIKYLTFDEKNKLFIATFGGSRMIFDKELAGFRNFVDVKDPIPFLSDPLGCFRGVITGGVTFLNSDHWFGLGHYFNNLVYQKELNALGQNLHKKNRRN